MHYVCVSCHWPSLIEKCFSLYYLCFFLFFCFLTRLWNICKTLTSTCWADDVHNKMFSWHNKMSFAHVRLEHWAIINIELYRLGWRKTNEDFWTKPYFHGFSRGKMVTVMQTALLDFIFDDRKVLQIQENLSQKAKLWLAKQARGFGCWFTGLLYFLPWAAR